MDIKQTLPPAEASATPPATSASAPYTVKLDLYEGPLDVLLRLITDQELDITKISLARVTEQFLAHLRALEQLHMPQVIDFLVVASELVLIKSRMLLPREALAPEEPEEESNLVERLQEFQRFKDAARALRTLMTTKVVQVGRPTSDKDRLRARVEMTCVLPAGFSVGVLRELMTALRDRQFPDDPTIEERLLEPRQTLQEKIALIQERLRLAQRLSFGNLAASNEAKMDIIISFLAILELAKQAVIGVAQDDTYADMQLTYLS